MSERIFYGIGLMSGTSLDGVDLCYVKFEQSSVTDFTMLHAQTIPYPTWWKKNLMEAFLQKNDTIGKLHLDYGVYLGNLINDFIKKNDIKEVDFIASHGHTIFHQPDQGITLQIGDGQAIANLTGYQVVCDFRSQDIAMGGQGAPLVPIGDRLLFSAYDASLNLGGFVNVSFERGNERIAFDICPINIVLNFYSEKLGSPYDKEGLIAASGQINDQLLLELNDLAYYKKDAPKSLGFEWVVETVIPLIDSYELEVKDVLRTVVEHVVIQIVNAIKPNQSMLVTGGGVFNTFFIERLKAAYTGEIIIPEKEIIEYKEALIFALLGLLKLEGKDNVLGAVTGAPKDHSSGVLYLPGS